MSPLMEWVVCALRSERWEKPSWTFGYNSKALLPCVTLLMNLQVHVSQNKVHVCQRFEHQSCMSVSLAGHSGGQQVLCAHRPRARAGGALTHRCYTTVRSSTQSFTARHTSAWVIMGNVLQLSVFTSTRQLRWRRLDSEKSRNAVRCRSEHMTNTSVPTSTNTPSVAELQLDLYVFWRKYESCLLVVVFFY